MKQSITVIILTKNESKHITRCINSVKDICDDIVVVDSFSDDDTCDIAAALGARVFKNEWISYANQFNYGVQQCGIMSDWIWRIDADEYVDDELGTAVRETVDGCGENVNGIYVRKRIDFMEHPLLHGGWYPCYYMKLFRRGHGECENRWMDEHLRIFDGETVTIKKGNQIDANMNSLTWWTEKHNGYATREMIDTMILQYGLDEKDNNITPDLFGKEEQRKRWLKIKYVKFPLFIRPFINFVLRYIVKGGFLDGKEGFIWHFFQGFWYRMLVDAKIYEFKKRFDFDDEKIREQLIKISHKK